MAKQPREARHAVRDALFLDIPYIIDSVCRHAEHWLNRRHRFKVGSAPPAKPYTLVPTFAFFLLILLYVAYGPTLTGLCGVLDAPTVAAVQQHIGKECIGAGILQFLGTCFYIHTRIAKRFRKQSEAPTASRVVVYPVLFAVLGVLALPLILYGRSLLEVEAFDTCRPVPHDDRPLAWVQLVAFIIAAASAVLLTFVKRIRWRVWAQGFIIAALVLVLWFLPDSWGRTEALQVPYRHVYGVLVALLAVIACCAVWLVEVPFRSMTDAERKAFQDALPHHELFALSRDDPPLSPRRIIGGCVIGILSKPLQFLLLPAFAIILVPSEYVWHACIAGTLAAALLVTAGTLTDRWDQMSQYLRRYFLLGSPLVVSLAVIVIAILRLADVQYVATVLNVAPLGILFTWTVMAYALTWWFEYQVNSVLAAKLLWVLGQDGVTDDAVVTADLGKDFAGKQSGVHPSPRYLAAHATGQFLVFGTTYDNEKHEQITGFHTHAFVELFEALLLRDDPQAAHEIGRRVQLYFALINVALVLGLVALFWYHGRGDRNNTVQAVVVAQHPIEAKDLAPTGANLVELLRPRDGAYAPAILVAASGGGTRAALYTATVLKGLHEAGAAKNIVLLSGVSGGGVAAAYFYAHRDELLSRRDLHCDSLNEADVEDPWKCYLDRMSMPFIRDVMEGAAEWRMQSRTPLGTLLAESFDRRLFRGTMLGANADLGIILNTTIAAHPVRDATTLRDSLVPRPHAMAPCRVYERPVSLLGGGRLAFSNLRNVSTFARSRPDIPAIQMPFVVVRDGAVRLAEASALNANFPPVFSNARVDLEVNPQGADCATQTYYVTDGGATENLGLLSALLALKSALSDPDLRGPFRDIDIVLAEASAIDFDYEQDRGVGAATGQSKERLAGRLTLELFEDVEKRASELGARIRIHDLSLPRVFRSRGGFGTHWMFPENITVTNPRVTPLPPSWQIRVAQYSGMQRFWVTLDKRELAQLWQMLFASDEAEFCGHEWSDKEQDLRVVAGWICSSGGTDADPLFSRWSDLKKAIGR